MGCDFFAATCGESILRRAIYITTAHPPIFNDKTISYGYNGSRMPGFGEDTDFDYQALLASQCGRPMNPP